MEIPLRICALNMFEIVTLEKKNISVGKVTNIKPFFEGGLGSIANLAVEIFTSLHLFVLLLTTQFRWQIPLKSMAVRGWLLRIKVM